MLTAFSYRSHHSRIRALQQKRALQMPKVKQGVFSSFSTSPFKVAAAE
jgi:hypothetical protein